MPFDAFSGTMNVPGGPGLGVDPLPDVLESTTVSRTLLRASP